MGRDTALGTFRERLRDGREIGLLVELSVPGLIGEGPFTPEQDVERAALIRAVANRVGGRLPARATPVRVFETAPFMSVRANLAAFEALLVDPEVVAIQEEGVSAPLASDAASQGGALASSAFVLMGPRGTTAGLSPLYRWAPVPGAKRYLLEVQAAAGGPALVNNWYEAGAVCDRAVCSVQPVAALSPGTEYRWRISVDGSSGAPRPSPYLRFTPQRIP